MLKNTDFTDFKVGDYGIFYNCIQHNMDNGGYDLPEGNGKYWQRALILNIRRDERYGDLLADVRFDSGLESRGHFLNHIKRCE